MEKKTKEVQLEEGVDRYLEMVKWGEKEWKKCYRESRYKTPIFKSNVERLPENPTREDVLTHLGEDNVLMRLTCQGCTQEVDALIVMTDDYGLCRECLLKGVEMLKN